MVQNWEVQIMTVCGHTILPPDYSPPQKIDMLKIIVPFIIIILLTLRCYVG